MATITTLASQGTGHQNRTNKRTPYLTEAYIDFAAATTAKGTALAAADVIEAIKLPAGTWVLAAGLQKVGAMTGSSTDLTLDFGVTGVNADAYVDGWDFDAAAVEAFAASPTTANEVTVVASTDTIDILIATQTGTLTGGVVRAWAIVQDISNLNDRPTIAQRKS